MGEINKKKVTKAVITAAGRGTRFLPATKAIPKEMLPIADKPIIQHLAEECVGAGIEDIIIVIRAGSESIIEHFNEDEGLEDYLRQNGKEEILRKIIRIHDMANFVFIYQDTKLSYGNGSPVLSAKSLLEDSPFALLWGDDLFYGEQPAIKQLVEFFEENECDGALGVQKMSMEEVVKYGSVKIKEGTTNQAERIIEKPEKNNAPSDLVSYGRMVLTPRIFEYLKPEATGKDGELWLQDANDELAENGKVLFKELKGEWFTTGDPASYIRAQMRFSSDSIV
ncbi:NTP transferase domain-containing protein [Candidatus Dojkabacteria bacterium]|nr:NTP transferase domain-containing protein [Candidatus Dojkabacteria bacterium]